MYFTSRGFNHLVYNAPKKMRNKRAQILRFDMLEKAKFILDTSTTYQEYDEEIVYKRVNRRGLWVPMNVLVRYWGLVAIVRKFRVKVVVKQEGNGATECACRVMFFLLDLKREKKLMDSEYQANAAHADTCQPFQGML